jgi:hypothetical protein
MRTWLLALLSAPFAALAQQGAIVTVLQGSVTVEQGAPVPKPAVVFAKLQAGDRLQLATDAVLQLVYFANGRQETWRDRARVEIGEESSSAAAGAAPASVRQLPQMLVRQLVKTPTADRSGKVAAVRLRAVVPPDALHRLEKNYAELRAQAETSDRTPELYLLAGLFEQHEYERIETMLAAWQRSQPADPALLAIADHYRAAMRAVPK